MLEGDTNHHSFLADTPALAEAITKPLQGETEHTWVYGGDRSL